MKNKIIISLILLLFSCSALAAAKMPVGDSSVSVWANEITVAIYTYDYTNTEENLKKIGKYFTSKGWPVFIQAVSDSKILETVKANKYHVSAVALDPPKITKKAYKGKLFFWTVTMPVLVKYHNEQAQKRLYLEVTLTIVHDNKNTGIRGLAAQEFNTKVIPAPDWCQGS